MIGSGGPEISLSSPAEFVLLGAVYEGGVWGLGAALRRGRITSLGRHPESRAWGLINPEGFSKRVFLPHARTGICDRFSIFPVEKSVDLPRNSADFGAKMAKNRKNSLGK